MPEVGTSKVHNKRTSLREVETSKVHGSRGSVDGNVHATVNGAQCMAFPVTYCKPYAPDQPPYSLSCFPDYATYAIPFRSALVCVFVDH